MLVFDSVIFKYTHSPILRGIYLSIPGGSIVGLFGHNGSGKSTLIKIGAGYLIQDDGNIFIDEKVISGSMSVKRYNNIAYLSQDSFLPKDLTVGKFIHLSNTDRTHFENDSLIDKIMNQKIRTLSGGELRYLEILFLFSLNRDYYLLDEPFTGIEPIIIERITEKILRQKSKGKGIIITDQYYRYLIDIIDHCYLLKDGYVKELNAAENFRDQLVKTGYLPN